MRITATSYEPGPRTRELHGDRPLLAALTEAHLVYLSIYPPTPRRFQGHDFTGQMAIVCGTTELLPEMVDARSAIGLRSGNGPRRQAVGKAALCARCQQPHLRHWVATFVLSSDGYEMPYTPIFGALCFRCYKAVIAR